VLLCTDLDFDRITALQKAGRTLPHVMRGFISWLAPRVDDLEERRVPARDELRGRFAESVAAIDASQAQDLPARAMGALKLAAAKQAATLTQNRPAETRCRSS
jgi:hypothetical protein